MLPDVTKSRQRGCKGFQGVPRVVSRGYKGFHGTFDKKSPKGFQEVPRESATRCGKKLPKGFQGAPRGSKAFHGIPRCSKGSDDRDHRVRVLRPGDLRAGTLRVRGARSGPEGP